MSDLLKQAIADAKAVRATALSNAKAALEESFGTRLQSMLSQKLAEELAEEGTDEVPETPAADAPHADAAQDAAAMAATAPAPEAAPAPEVHADAAQDAAMAAAPAPEAAPAAEAPAEEPAVAEAAEEMEEDTNSYPGTHAGAGVPGHNLEEAKKASGNYNAKTKGHKTEDPGKKMVVDATKLSTAGEPKAAADSHAASPDYKKTTSGHKTDDPQGQGNELADGAKKAEDQTANLNEEAIDESSLEEILKELESGLSETNMDEAGTQPQEAAPTEAAAPAAEELEEINLEELLSEEGKTDEGIEDLKKWQEKHGKGEANEAVIQENISLKKELEEYRSAVQYLRTQINEINLLNSKLLYTNKLFKQGNFSNEQKLKIIESFDLTKSVREAKLVYATLAESLNNGAKKTEEAAKKPVSTTVKNITEGLASKPVASTKPTTTAVLTEGADMANRFKKLAGIRK